LVEPAIVQTENNYPFLTARMGPHGYPHGYPPRVDQRWDRALESKPWDWSRPTTVISRREEDRSLAAQTTIWFSVKSSLTGRHSFRLMGRSGARSLIPVGETSQPIDTPDRDWDSVTNHASIGRLDVFRTVLYRSSRPPVLVNCISYIAISNCPSGCNRDRTQRAVAAPPIRRVRATRSRPIDGADEQFLDQRRIAHSTSSTSNRAPPCDESTTASDQPWASTIVRTIASPYPEPEPVLTPKRRTYSRRSNGIPGPSSST